MPEGNEAVEWDFLTFVTGWNLYALPVLLLVTGGFIFVKNRRWATSDARAIDFDSRRLVRIVALIHLSLGLHGIIRLVQELLTMRVMGVTESFANFIVEMLSAVVNPLLAIGFWRVTEDGSIWGNRLVCLSLCDCCTGDPLVLALSRARRSQGVAQSSGQQGDAALSSRHHVSAASKTGFRT